MKKILITGTAGFIGFHLASKLILEKYEVFGLDIINDYYDIELKYSRLSIHGIDARSIKDRELYKSNKYENYNFIKADIADYDFIIEFMNKYNFDYVVNLAAQAGVRYSIENPRAYTHSNIDGFLSILEGAKQSNVKHLLYASTSSVYGLNTKMPLSEDDTSEHPMALYAATKKANELMAHSYSHLFQIPTTGMRFFTVYGPWGRPDMALFLFTKAILNKEPINVFNNGNMIRDFTYIDDIIESIFRLITKPPVANLNWDSENPKISTSSAPYKIFNIGNSSPVKLIYYIEALEKAIGTDANKNYIPIQPGDVLVTHAKTENLETYINFKPSTSITEGVNFFYDWFKLFYKNNNK
jgi:UDP-glucuronate 4-epimerase